MSAPTVAWDFLSSPMMMPAPCDMIRSPIELAMFRCMHYILSGFEEDMRLQITHQARVLNYKVDFLIASSAGVPLLVIECDGHDFHERTKEQASKDKSREREILAATLLPMMRFTGSEIWSNTFECATEAICFAMSKALGK